MREIVRYANCFVCGEANPHGLHVQFYFDGTDAHTELIAAPWQEGYKGLLHGGILATILDEVMIKALLAKEVYAVTAELTVRYHRPVASGETLRFRGRIVEERGKVVKATGLAVSASDERMASAEATYIRVKGPLAAQLTSSIGPDV